MGGEHAEERDLGVVEDVRVGQVVREGADQLAVDDQRDGDRRAWLDCWAPEVVGRVPLGNSSKSGTTTGNRVRAASASSVSSLSAIGPGIFILHPARGLERGAAERPRGRIVEH